MDVELFNPFRDRVRSELEMNLIPFWTERVVDYAHGGFVGRMTNSLVVVPNAPKGLILHARMLWTFSALYRMEDRPEYLKMAQRAFEYLTLKFQDTHYGGYFWMLSARGEPVDVKKKIYGQAFVIYALSEFARATANQIVLGMAVELFELIEKICVDQRYLGYFESYNRDWTLAEDYRLSVKDMDEKKSMNTHLHVLEAYSNLALVTEDPVHHTALKTLVHIFLDHIIDSDRHCFRLFFNERWQPKTGRISFGHDIEGSWLLTEAADVLKDPALSKRVRGESVRMADAVLERGLDEEGAVVYEGNAGGLVDDDRHWWPQAEGVVGFLNGFQLSREERFFSAAYRCWQFIETHMVDGKHGEWFWKITRQGRVDDDEYKVSEWKGPYHNVRACLEIMRRLDQLGQSSNL